jgi:DNA-binding transcriptional MerR regulator
LICARTKNPAYWINYAKENKLSVRKLTNAIQQNNDQKDIEKPIEKPKECECETVNKDEDGHSIDCTNTTLCRWHMGEWYRSRCVEEGASITDLSKKCGLSCAEIREIIKTYRAFPEPKNRDSDLSYTHHRICANTTDPKGWLRKAKENNWSTRELSEVISGKPVNTIISLKQKIAELEAQLVEKDRQFAFITKEQSKNLPTTGHLFGLYQKITEQEQKIFALQKFNLVCLSSLQKKNASLLENARRAR